MRRIFIGGIALLLCGGISAHNKSAAAAKSDPLMFVFLRVDREHDVAILRPMIAPDIGVQLDSGSRTLKPGAVLRCQTSTREHSAIAEGEVTKVSELILDCDGQKFIVKGLDFSPRRQPN